MRKLMVFAVALVGMVGGGRCDMLWDEITAGFVGNAKMAMEFTSKGNMQYEFLDNVVEIGRLNGGRIGAIDIGALGEQLPDETVAAVQWCVGAKVHLAPFLKNYVVLNPEWQFLNTLEIDGRYSYNFTKHSPTLGLSIGYPFK